MDADVASAVGDEPRREAWVRRSIQLVLRGGLAIAVALMAVGAAVSYASGERTAPAVRLFELRGQSAGETIMALGVLVLALTPLLRVLVLIALWGVQRDLRFVTVAAVVLVVLVGSALVGHG